MFTNAVGQYTHINDIPSSAFTDSRRAWNRHNANGLDSPRGAYTHSGTIYQEPMSTVGTTRGVVQTSTLLMVSITHVVPIANNNCSVPISFRLHY